MSDPTDNDLKALAAVLGLTLSAVVWHRTAGTLAQMLREQGLDDELVERFVPTPIPRPIPAPMKAKAPARKPKPTPIQQEDPDLAPLPAPITRTAGLSLAAAWSSFATMPTLH